MTNCQHTEQTCSAVDGDGDYFHSTWTCDACGREELTTHPKAPEVIAWEQSEGAA